MRILNESKEKSSLGSPKKALESVQRGLSLDSSIKTLNNSHIGVSNIKI